MPFIQAFTLLVFASLVSLTATARVGAVDGGGGKSVVCRDTAGAITSAELLDLYEGRVQFGFEVKPSAEPMLVQAEMVMLNLAKGRGEDFIDHARAQISYINEWKTILPEGTGLVEIDDSHHVIVPKNCKVEQLANFTNQNQVLIDGEIWKALNETNRAALLVHEALYKFFRNYGATDSMRARKAVAMGFAGIVTENIKMDVPANAWDCISFPNENGNHFPGSKFWAYNDENGELIFQFDYLEGSLMLTNSTLMIDTIPVGELDKVGEVTYWLGLNSLIEGMANVALSFQKMSVDGHDYTQKTIGFGSMPDMPTQRFECFPPEAS